jgi:hypothetical protein
MGRVRAVRAFVTVVVLSSLLPRIASADDRARGQELFVEAAEARDEGRWADARALLEESLAVFPHFPTAWNLVAALEETHALPAAEQLLTRMLEGDFGALQAAERGSVTERLESVGERLGTVVVIVPPDVGAMVRVGDGEAMEVDASGRLVLRLVPGITHVRAVAGERSEARTVGVVARETRTVSFELRPADALVSTEPEVAPAEARSVWSSPWLWVTLGVLVVGAGVLTGVLLAGGNEDPVPADFMSPPL